MKTGIVKDWRYTEHQMGIYHPESPQRIEILYRMLEKETSFSSYPLIKPRSASEEEIAMVHTLSYVEMIKETAGRERVVLDPDTSTCPRSYEVACLAAGGLLVAADMIMEGKIQHGIALVRPPGHHAEASQARGFCIFNNIAIAAQHLIKKHGLRRILIADWDLHHGNGTQNSFYGRRDVLYFSIHQFPHYPGSGYWNEVGIGEGEGFTVNVPLSSGKTDSDYGYIFRRILFPIAAAYKPEFILVSAGFDVYEGDPLGGMMVSPEGCGMMTAELMTMAHSLCRDRLLLTLEGGYHPVGLEEGMKHVLWTLGGKEPAVPVKTEVSSSTERELVPVVRVMKKYWPV